ncbi:MAG: ATP-binding cassette domain-containing protein [Polyangiaceae bacterium]
MSSLLGVGIGHAGLALSAGWVARAVVNPQAKPLELGLSTVCLIGLLASLVKAAAQARLAGAQIELSAAVGNRVRLEVARGLLAQGGAGGAQHLLARIAVRIRDVEQGVQGWLVLHRAVAQLLPLAAALILLSPLMAIGAVGVLLPFGLWVAGARKRWKLSAQEAQVHSEHLHQHVDELVGNLDLFRSYGAGDQVLAAMQQAGSEAGAKAARVEVFRAGLSGANEALGAFAVLGAVLLAERLGVGLGDGTLLAFAAVFFMAYRPLRDLGDGRGALVKGQAALEALSDMIGERSSPAVSFAWGNEPLECRAFRQAERGPALDISLRHGELCWLRGENGSGKTTLVRCLLGLEPATGGLAYGARSLSGAAVGPSQRPFAWVPQDAPMVTGSLLDNVRLMGASEAQGDAALALLGAEWLRQRLGDERLGPGGRSVSGGERRLVALARAVATEQPVLLLDEPLVGVDAEGRERILSALGRVRGERSLIVVSHEALPADLVDHEVHLSPKSTTGSDD